MSNERKQSKLDELIQELCPDGVEYKTLGELGKFYGGITGKSKDDFTDGNAKFITYKNVYSNPALDIYVDDKVKISADENQRTLEYGDVIFTGSSETPDECGISSVLTQQTDEKLYLNSFCFVFRFDDASIMLPDFSKHLFRSRELRYQIGKTANGVTRFNVSKKMMEKVKLPVPPLEVQREIVHILDYFTLLTAELTARKKQYEFYRDKLLTFDDVRGGATSDVAWRILGEVCNLKSGKAISAYLISDTQTVENPIPCYGANGLRGYVSTSNESGDKPIVGRQGAQCGNVCFATGFYYATEHAVVVTDKGFFNSRFLYHLLVNADLNQYKTAGAQPGLSVARLNEVKVPVPTRTVQDRIANVLDNFDAICSDLNIGLPAEIEARQKQYEFYRDKLLSFKQS